MGYTAPAGPPPPPEVGYVTMEPRRVTLTTELPGRTSAMLVAEVRPEVGGIIVKRLFTEGADVKAGEVLYEIDPSTYQAAHASAKAALARAEANVVPRLLKAERYKELVAINAVSRQDADDADAALRQAEAEVQGAKAALETAQINLGKGPQNLAITPDGRYALVTSSGTDCVAVVDLPKLVGMLESADPQERREIIFPFIWGTVAKQGQLFGNRTLGSDAHVTNGRAFSYPGYNEMSVGFPNPDINSNGFGPNPNATVFEWLNRSPDLAGESNLRCLPAAKT